MNDIKETNPEVQALVAFAEGRGWVTEWMMSNPRQLSCFIWHADKPHPNRTYASIEEMQNIKKWRDCFGI